MCACVSACRRWTSEQNKKEKEEEGKKLKRKCYTVESLVYTRYTNIQIWSATSSKIVQYFFSISPYTFEFTFHKRHKSKEKEEDREKQKKQEPPQADFNKLAYTVQIESSKIIQVITNWRVAFPQRVFCCCFQSNLHVIIVSRWFVIKIEKKRERAKDK